MSSKETKVKKSGKPKGKKFVRGKVRKAKSKYHNIPRAVKLASKGGAIKLFGKWDPVEYVVTLDAIQDNRTRV